MDREQEYSVSSKILVYLIKAKLVFVKFQVYEMSKITRIKETWIARIEQQDDPKYNIYIGAMDVQEAWEWKTWSNYCDLHNGSMHFVRRGRILKKGVTYIHGPLIADEV